MVVPFVDLSIHPLINFHPNQRRLLDLCERPRLLPNDHRQRSLVLSLIFLVHNAWQPVLDPTHHVVIYA